MAKKTKGRNVRNVLSLGHKFYPSDGISLRQLHERRCSELSGGYVALEESGVLWGI